MRGRKTRLVVCLSEEDRRELEAWQRSTTLSAGLARRARVILLVEQGHTFVTAARLCDLTVRNARKWVLRFLRQGIAGLRDPPGRGRKPVFSPRGSPVSGQDRLRATG
jgi:hypothetical protein